MRKNGFFRGSKKGNAVVDTILVIVFLFGFAIFSVTGYVIYSNIQSDLVTSVDNQEAKDLANDLNTNYPLWFDGAFIMAFVLLWLFVLGASLFVDTHPMFFVLAILMFVFVIVVAAVLSNSFEEIGDEQEYQAIQSDFAKTFYIMDHLVEFTMAIIFSIGGVLYGKSRI
jgi:flagellar biosynthesis protein FlhB